MADKLIIVESPTKVHTIKKFLGSGYDIVASQGHIRDLPKSQLGVDVDNDFTPKYITIRGKSDVLSAIRKEVKKADKIYLATDPDREGEAISWHIMNAFDMKGKTVSRITFNEITKNAVKEALKKPQEINEDLVDAQQARRVLDRVVGYQISPILWKKVKSKLSAGRVQSAVLRMICDREDEISAFVPQEYWSLKAALRSGSDEKPFLADYYGRDGKKETPHSKEEVDALKGTFIGKEFELAELTVQNRMKYPFHPFTTSTLQQEASSKLNFSTQKTMRLAQELYEGVQVKGRGTIGLITYLRTDSVRIAQEADAACKRYIAETYGEKQVGSGAYKKGGTNIQDAHEAIRPTDVFLTPEMLRQDLSRDLFRLYQLIFRRFVASRMKPAVYENANARFECGELLFTSAASRLLSPGFLTVYDTDEEKSSGDPRILKLEKGDRLMCEGSEEEQHFTQPPPHYTEATLVRAMEENGLGRPSTYAPTITNILGKHYITKEGRNIFVTELGDVVNNLMKTSFPDIVDLSFTAQMEKKLDEIAAGKKDWHEVLREFYPGFRAELEKAEKELEHVKVEDEKSDEICELCGRTMVIKYGQHGKFLACPGFPECRNTKQFLEKAGVKCPKCGAELVIRRTRKGRRYYACEKAPECDFMSWQKPKEN